MKLHKILTVLAATAIALSAKAQKDTVYTVSDVEVVVSREKTFNAGTSTWQADSSILAQYKPNTLADILSQQSGSMFLRTFTPGALATPVARGTYAVHTAIVWNGFNILSPMNQLSDLNLIPAFFIDGLALGMGSQNALYGSGAIGSTISFNQTQREKDGLHGSVLGGIGSFGTYQQGAKFSYKKGFYTGKVRYFNQIAQNNYEYINTAAFGKPVQRLENARAWLNGQMFENYFK
ncbi:MAG TPA: TonB-dependent receptor plug domain-containing protein, partial [Bacteroidia bacterium]|nr:TonB-dependent receptor plug domain-containing protein [Bacteroidia bacterium]